MRLQQPNKLTAARQTRETVLRGAGNRSLRCLLQFLALIRGSAIGSTPAFGAGYPGSSPGPGAIPLLQSSERNKFCLRHRHAGQLLHQAQRQVGFPVAHGQPMDGPEHCAIGRRFSRGYGCTQDCGERVTRMLGASDFQTLSSRAGFPSNWIRNRLGRLHQAKRAYLSAFHGL